MLRKSFYIYVSKMGGYLVHTALPMVLVRILSMADFGSYRQFFVMELTVLTIFQLGVNQALYYFIPRDTKNAGAYFFNSLFLNIALFITAFMVLRLFAAPLGSLLKMPLLTEFFWLLALDTLCIMLGASAECYLLARDRVKIQAVLEIVGRVFISLSTLVSALVWHDLGRIILVMVLARCVQLAAQLLYIQFAMRGFRSERYFFDLWQQIRYSVVLGAGGSLGSFQGRIHNLVVSGMFGREVFAVYSAGCTEIPVLQYFGQSLATVSLGQFALLVKDGKQEEIRRLWREIMAHMYGFTLPVVIGFLIIAKPFIILAYTSAYAGAVTVFMINSLIKLNFIWNSTLVLRALGRNDVTFWFSLAMIVVGTPLMMLAAKVGGTVAVIAVNGTLLIGGRIFAVYLLNRISSLNLAYVVHPREILAFYRDLWAKGQRLWHNRGGRGAATRSSNP